MKAGETFTIRLFWYTSAEYLESNLHTGRVVLTEVAKSNDPFEYLPTAINPISKHNTSEDELQSRKELLKKYEASRAVYTPMIVCLSASMSASAMWGHYAKNHKGVCLVFELPVTSKEEEKTFPIIPVKYKQNRAYFGNYPSDGDESDKTEFINEILALKGEDWSYEREFRILTTMHIGNQNEFEKQYIEVQGEKFFFTGLMGYLKGVILGLNCDLSEAKVKFMLDKYQYENVSIVKADKHYTEFKVYTKEFEDMHSSQYEFLRDLNPILFFVPKRKKGN